MLKLCEANIIQSLIKPSVNSHCSLLNLIHGLSKKDFLTLRFRLTLISSGLFYYSIMLINNFNLRYDI